MITKYTLRIINALITFMTDPYKSKTEKYGLLVGTYIIHVLILVGYVVAISSHLGKDNIVVLITVIVVEIIAASLYHITSKFIKIK